MRWWIFGLSVSLVAVLAFSGMSVGVAHEDEPHESGVASESSAASAARGDATAVPVPAPDFYPTPEPPTAHETTLSAQVVFDGEGEAAVAANLALSAVDTDTKEVVVTIPGDTVRLRRALQEYTVKTETPSCDKYGDYDVKLQDYPCLVTRKSVSYETKVERIEPQTSATADGLKVTLVLPHPIAVGESTSVVLAYKATGYATERAGVWKFTYPTPIVAYDLDNVTVRVDVADDLVLKGGGAATRYQASLAEGIATGALQTFDSGLAPEFSRVIAEPEAYVKSTTALDPNESFEVRGAFAASWARIYWPQLLLVLVAMLLFVGLVIWGERRAARLGER